MTKSTIKEIHLLPQYISEKIQINNCVINKLSIIRTSSKGEIEINKCWVNSFGFLNFRNYGILKIINCLSLRIPEKNSHFIIDNCNMGKSEFFQFDFSTFDEINIRNSIVSDCAFVNTIWTNNFVSFAGDQLDDYRIDRLAMKSAVVKRVQNIIKGSFRNEIESKEQLENKRDVYKQIKYALSKQGDSVNEQLFHNLEMKEYYRTLTFFSKNCLTKLIIGLSYQTSNFGQSLSRPLLWLFFGHLVLFYLVIIFGGFQVFLLPKFNFEKAFETYFIYINPLRNTSMSLTGFLIIIDLLMRIWSSYMIYNLIRASRRFIK